MRLLLSIFLIFIGGILVAQKQLDIPMEIPENPQIEEYNFVLGTHAIGGKYKFTDDSYLVEQAKQIRAMGSNILKISLGKKYFKVYSDMTKDPSIKTTTDLIRKKKDFRKVIDMDFKYYFFWVHTHTGINWRKGLNPEQKLTLYKEVYELAEFLFTEYKNSGKTFFLGNWEGDWLLHGIGKAKNTPSEQRIKAMQEWFELRQAAVDDAKKQIAHSNVNIWHYVEANLVKKGMLGKPCIVESILPNINVDLVSYSSYESIKRKGSYPELRYGISRIMDYIESKMKPKEGIPFERRVFIGEYGYGIRQNSYQEQSDKTKRVMRAALELNLPFVLHWEMYNNEYHNGVTKGMSLISEKGEKKPVYHLHADYYQAMNDYLKKYKSNNGEYPSQKDFNEEAIKALKKL